jgi:hypothetical protein
MRDEVRFSTGGGALGRLVAKTLVRRHLKTFLIRRNAVIKRVAESDEWHRYLDGVPQSKKESREKDGSAAGTARQKDVGAARVSRAG